MQAVEESRRKTAMLVEQQAEIAALKKKIAEKKFASQQAVAAVKRQYKERISEIRAGAEQDKVAAQLLDSESISDKLREMQVPFTKQQLDRYLSR